MRNSIFFGALRRIAISANGASRVIRFFVLGTIIGVAPPLTAAATNLPDRSMPAGLRLVDGKFGGRILTGPLGGVHSPVEAFGHGLQRAATYFDRPPRVQGAVRSTDGTLTVGLFRATLAARAVAGLILVTYGPRGGSRFALVFDRPANLHKSLSPMLVKLTALVPAVDRSATGAPRANVMDTLRPISSPDRSVHVLVPSDWKTLVFAQGQFAASGPHGEEVDQEVMVNLVDPRSSVRMRGLPLRYDDDPTSVFIAVTNMMAAAQQQPRPNVVIEKSEPAGGNEPSARHLVGTMTVKGVRERFENVVVTAPPGPAGGWSVTLKQISAPVATFASALPTMLAIFNSYNVDQSVRHDQVLATQESNVAGAQHIRDALAQTNARNSAVFKASMSHAHAVQAGIDRSTAGFTRYLNDTDVVEHAPSGQRATVDYDFARAIVLSDPQSFRTVPVSEYVRGVDY